MEKEYLLNGVEDTLYIPLSARIYVSEKFPSFFYDKKSLSLKNINITRDIDNSTNEYFYMASVCRQYVIDKKIKEFLNKNVNSNVVFLGAGLETAYNRIGNKLANFYQIDLSNVINIRKEVLGVGENENLIEGDMFNLDWIDRIDISLPTLIVAAGVYQYFNEDKIVNMIKNMKKSFCNMELVFDATNVKGLSVANRYVKRTGNKNATMYFSVDNPYEFAEKIGMKVISIDGFFKEAITKCKGLKYKTKLFMYFSDKLNRTKVIYFN